MSTLSSSNTQNLLLDLEWLEKCIDNTLNTSNNSNFSLPEYTLESPSTYAQFITQNNLTVEDRLLFILGLCTSIKPTFLEKKFNSMHSSTSHGTSSLAYGGLTGKNFRGFIPTGETFLFLVAGNQTEKRLEAIRLLKDSPLILSSVITFGESFPGEPLLSGPIIVNDIILHAILMDAPIAPTTQPS